MSKKASTERKLRIQIVLLVALVFAYVAHFRLLDGRIQDDAYISFRYARNLVEGHGLVWNVGERVEGYTNFLWTLLVSAALATSSKVSPMQFARAVSSFAGYGAMVASFLLVRQMAPKTKFLPLVAPALLAGSWAFAINTMTGLETVFYAALVTIATLLLVMEHDDCRYRGSSIVFALAALTRPEAIGLFGLLAVATAFGQRQNGATARQYLTRLAAPFAIIVGAHELFRFTYYGHLVPNTYFAKFGVELPAGMPTRSEYLADFFKKGMDPLGLSAMLVALFVLAKWKEPRSRLIAIGALYGFLNVGLGGADFMIGFRYLVPYLPLLYVSAALGCAFIAERFGPIKRRRPVEVVALALSAAAAFSGYTHSRDKLRPFEQLRFRVNSDSNTALGEWLGKSLPADTVVVARDIGELGYLSHLPIVDMTGLTDDKIARRPGNLLDRELDVNDVFSRNPGAFVFVSRVPGQMDHSMRFSGYSSPRSTTALLMDSRMNDYSFFARYPRYEVLGKSADGSWQAALRGAFGGDEIANTYFLELYLRKDLAAVLRN